jgi:Fe-S-cluster containining protein
MTCARSGSSCCKNYQIHLTTGDIHRISAIIGNTGFVANEFPVSEEIDPDYDPQWLPMIMSQDGRVRVLKRTSEKNCVLLTSTGCSLPFDSRPLICRLYPYTYSESGILGIDTACPISRDSGWATVLKELDMPAEKAKQWCMQLYQEVRDEHFPTLTACDKSAKSRPVCTHR